MYKLKPILPMFGTPEWFRFYQLPLLWMLNFPQPKVRQYFRENLTNIDFDDSILINKITKNSVHFAVDKDIIQAEFFTFDRQSNLIRRNFDRLLSPLHQFDMRFANPFVPILNMGYDTLTVYSSGSDGYVYRTYSTSFSNTRNAASGATANNSSSYEISAMSCYHATGSRRLYRAYIFVDTTALGSGKEISSANVSLYGRSNGDSNVSAQECTVNSITGVDDYSAFTGSSFGNTSSWSTSAYNDIALNASGKTYVNNRANTNICLREYTYDYSNNDPGDAKHANGCYFSENTGTTNDPKITIVYGTPAGTFKPRIIVF